LTHRISTTPLDAAQATGINPWNESTTPGVAEIVEMRRYTDSARQLNRPNALAAIRNRGQMLGRHTCNLASMASIRDCNLEPKARAEPGENLQAPPACTATSYDAVIPISKVAAGPCSICGDVPASFVTILRPSLPLGAQCF